MAKETRARGFAFVLYPESAPENWRSILDDFHIEWVESPLHDKDVDPTGELKKPHWHIVLAFDTLKSYDQIVEMIKPLNCPRPEKLKSIKGYVRYFCHLDNPEKYQYPISEIIAHGGFDLASVFKASASERYCLIKEMCEYVSDWNITEFYELLDYAMSEKFDSWFPLLCDNSAYIVNQYIKSNRERVFRSRKED